MGLLHRRFPRYVRPLPFLGCALVALVGFHWGLNWTWDWSLQTGNLFLLLLIPRDLVTLSGGKALLLIAGFTSLFQAFTWGTLGEALARRHVEQGTRGWRAVRFRFYPLTALFGLFLLYFGLVFLFDASVYGDRAPGGLVAFIYLDYAGLGDRPLTTSLGVSIAVTGLLCMTRFAFERGLGRIESLAPSPAPASVSLESAAAAPVSAPTRTSIAPPRPVPAPATPRPLFSPRTVRNVLVQAPATARLPVALARAPPRQVGPPTRPQRRPSTDPYLGKAGPR